ncbi:MAG: histidinol-phosphate transaminase [Dehalococcoidia bacterium]|nr:histidinol-phosphate transaminase [Dehalococcoidia bacterium]
MTPYAYVAPLEAATAESGVAVDRIIKLDGNENPYGCSPKVKKALLEYPFYHIYPDSEQRELRQALQRYVSAPFESIIAGSGSDELIEFVMRLFIDPGDRVINCVPTFGMYQFSTDAWGGKVTTVPRNADFAVDVAEVKKAAGKGTKIIFIASPNNPSGNVTPEQDILQLLELPVVVVLDEAYYEFSQKTLVPLVRDHGNLIVLRTFSKWAGLAGLRVGYGVFPDNIAKHLFRIKPPYNVNAAAQLAALESLKDLDYLQSTVKAIVAERQRLFDKLAEFQNLRPWPSEANFILCSVVNHNAQSICQELKRRGILIRYFKTPLLKNYIRISVGRPDHTDALVAALSDILLK